MWLPRRRIRDDLRSARSKLQAAAVSYFSLAQPVKSRQRPIYGKVCTIKELPPSDIGSLQSQLSNTSDICGKAKSHKIRYVTGQKSWAKLKVTTSTDHQKLPIITSQNNINSCQLGYPSEKNTGLFGSFSQQGGG